MKPQILSASIAGTGFWAHGLPSWETAREFVVSGTLPENPPARPSPQLLAPNERRRAPETVAVALEVALAACTAAGRDPTTLSSVFASTHGDLTITDYMCATLAHEPRTISPTRFHNSVHNAAAGYWTIGAGAMAATTAISAFDGSFAQGLLEALSQLATGMDAVLLVGYDGGSSGPLAHVSRSEGLLGGALLLVRDALPGRPRLHVATRQPNHQPVDTPGALSQRDSANAMKPMLPLFEALALRKATAIIKAGNGKFLEMEITYE